jgi:hypothetical protein
MHGAALLYNLMLAEQMPNEEGISRYHGELEKWLGLLNERAEGLDSWNRPAFWQMLAQPNTQIPAPTRTFADTWIDIALNSVSTGNSVSDNDHARRLIADRELYLKRNRARLRYREYLEMWGGASGTTQLSYRWSQAQTITLDILKGLGSSESHADAA